MTNIDREVRGVIGGANGTAYYAVLDYIQSNFARSVLVRQPVFRPSNQYTAEEKHDLVSAMDWSQIDWRKVPPYVLIIDEINRGNVSQIFGELITLIEDGKRMGQDEALTVTLPYSRETFSIPPNLYLIGTMNTADRSVEALDTALRRRFVFEHMPPKPELLLTVEGIDLKAVLSTINERLELLLDADRTIGHAWLLGVKSLDDVKEAFRAKILPLLQEFFYNDLGKVGLVLGEAFVEMNEAKSRFAKFSGYQDYSEYNHIRKFRLRNVDHLTAGDFISIYGTAAGQNGAA